jgi:3-phosphoshikimate 1-carboxyvinyltransferase
VPLSDLIEIVPLDKPVRAEITVPGSKSITNRALILAALADGETTLQGALWSEDTQVMVECLQELGFMVNVEPDPNEFCNRTITVYGKGGLMPPGGSDEQPAELFVGNAGTAARFLTALVCLGKGVYRLHGVPRMHERPQASLFQALRELGYRIDSPNDKLPAVIYGAGPHAGKCRVSIAESSQFASALILCSIKGGWSIEITGQNVEELPYVQMTDKLLATFPHHGGVLQIEPDASSGSYFLAAHYLLPPPECLERGNTRLAMRWHRSLSVAHWPRLGWQIDAHFGSVMQRTATLHQGLELIGHPEPKPNTPAPREISGGSVISRRRDLGDSIMTAIVLAPFGLDSVRFTDLGPLRLQECERVSALRTELTKCGARVVEEGDTLTVYPSQLHAAEIETYNDHRMAMCFAILGLKVPGIKIKNPSCVKKTFPNFFQKLAATPPKGLGVTIRDAGTGRTLTIDELFAE